MWIALQKPYDWRVDTHIDNNVNNCLVNMLVLRRSKPWGLWRNLI